MPGQATAVGTRYRVPAARGLAERLIPITSIVGFVLLWLLISRSGWVSEFFMPGPERVLATMGRMLWDGSLFVHAGASLARVAAGFLIAVAVAIPVGMGIGLWGAIFHLVDPWIELVRPIPPIAWIPLAILWLGLGEESKVFIIAYGAFFPIALNTMTGFRGVERIHVWAARALGASRRQIFWQVIVRAALPRIVVGLRLGAGMAFVVLVAAELILAYSGLGFLIMDGRERLVTDQILVGMVAIGLIGYGLNRGLLWAEKRVIRYREI